MTRRLQREAISQPDEDQKASHHLDMNNPLTMAKRPLSVLLLMLAAVAAALVAPASQARAEDCPNAAFRTGASANLPDCRAYELVTPGSDRIGDAYLVPAIQEDGNAIAWGSSSGLPDAQLVTTWSFAVARRGIDGWTSADANLHNTEFQGFLGEYVPVMYSPDLSAGIFTSTLPADLRDKDNGEKDLYRRAFPNGNVDWLTQAESPSATEDGRMSFLGASPDLSRVVFDVYGDSLVPGAPSSGIYLRDETGLHLISVFPDGTPVENVELAGGVSTASFPGGGGSMRVAHGGSHAVSDDATRIFFYADPAGGGPGPFNPIYVWDRNHTALVSGSQRSGEVGMPKNAFFIGASHDGGVVYFESPEQLTDDAPIGGGIYRFELETQDLQLLTPDAGRPAGLEFEFYGGTGSYAIMSDDASHVYFTTTAVLTADAPAVVSGVNTNLYVWSEEGTHYIATVGSGEGGVQRTSRDGRYAVILSRSSLGNADVNGHQAIYLYDDEAKTLRCASCRSDGEASQADSSLDAPVLYFSSTSPHRNITDDGRIFFNSSDHLLPADIGAGTDVYEYSQGKLSLLTPGSGDDEAWVGESTDNGSDVFIFTRQRLKPSDADADQIDVYDARVNGGFPDPPLPPDPCEDESCQGPAAPKPRLASPAAPETSSSRTRRSVKIVPLTAEQAARLARTGQGLVVLRTVGKGIATLRAHGAIDGRLTTLGMGRHVVRQPGPARTRVTLRLTPTARRALAAHGRLHLTIAARFSGLSTVSRTAVTLTNTNR